MNDNNNYITKQPKLRFSGFDDLLLNIKLFEIENKIFNFDLNSMFFVDASSIMSKKYIEWNKQKCKNAPIDCIIFLKDGSNCGNFFYTNIPVKIATTCDFIFTNQINKYIFYLLIFKSNYFRNNLVTGNAIPHIYKKDILNENLIIHKNKIEQQKIANFLSLLDKQIDLHVRKLELTNQLKKYYLNNLFTNNGIPKLRFKEFHDNLKYNYVKDLFNITRGLVLSKSKLIKHGYPVYSSQTLNNGLLGFYDSYLFENAITWTTDGANAGTVNFRKGKFYCTNVCGVLTEKKEKPNIYFACLLSQETKKYVSTGLGNPKLMNNTMGDIKINYCDNVIEQNKISHFLSLLDIQIDNISKRKEILKKYKKYYLNNLFI